MNIQINETLLLNAVADAMQATYLQNESSTIDTSETCIKYASTECAYRGESGNKCTIGHMISDEFYHSDMERETVDHELVETGVRNSLRISVFTQEEIDFLGAVQNIHDSTPLHSDDYWEASEFKDRYVDCIRRWFAENNKPMIKRLLPILRNKYPHLVLGVQPDA